MRTPKPFFRAQTQSWYLQIHGRQINLGRDEKAALREYHRIMGAEQVPTPAAPVDVLLDEFLDWTKRNRSPRTFDWYQEHLQSFLDFLPKLKISDLKNYHVTKWLENSYSTSGDTHRHGAVRTVQRALNWAVDEGYIPASPIKSYKKPPPQPREIYITPEQWTAFLARIKAPEFRDLAIFMRQTGCRPQEVRAITRKHLEGNCVVFDTLESKGKRVKRVIPLTSKALTIVERLAGEGPIFRNQKGRPWTSYALSQAFRRHAGDDPIFPYAVRHTFITDMLLAGMDPIKLAEIAGHKDLKMIMRVYSHLHLKRDHLREELQKAIGEDGEA